MYWLASNVTEKATRSLPHSENERQTSVNDSLLCIVGYRSGGLWY